MKKFLLLTLALFSASTLASIRTHEVHCLAENIYHEARGEPLAGQAMVAYATINRVKDKRWASTVCGVVHQPSQFSWTLKVTSVKEHRAFDDSLELAEMIYDNFKRHPKETYGDGVNHYLRCDWRNKVKWWRKMDYLGQIGEHCFYKGY